VWEGSALGDNFEGMTLGPSLDAGDRSLVLISDDGGVTRTRLLALRYWEKPAPTPAAAPPAARRSRQLAFEAGIAVAVLLGALALRNRFRGPIRR